MSIRRGPIPADSFTIIDNRWLRDCGLSWKAKGLLSYIASHAPGHQLTMEQIFAEATDGPDSVRSGLKELEEHGYLIRSRVHDGRGRTVGTDFELTYPGNGSSYLGNPHLGKPAPGPDQQERDEPAGQYHTGKSEVGKSGAKKTTSLKEDQENISTSFDAEASPNAGKIIAGYIDWLSANDDPVKLTSSVIARLGKEIKSCLKDGIDESTVKRALVEMARRGKAGWPSMLQSFVVEVQNRPVSAPPAGPRAPQFKNSEEQAIERKRIRMARAKMRDALMAAGATFDEAKERVAGVPDSELLNGLYPSSALGYIDGDVIDEVRPEVES